MSPLHTLTPAATPAATTAINTAAPTLAGSPTHIPYLHNQLGFCLHKHFHSCNSSCSSAPVPVSLAHKGVKKPLGKLLKESSRELLLHPRTWYIPFGLGTHNDKGPNATDEPWPVALAVPRLVFDLSCSRFPPCSSWPSQHKENVITGAGGAVTKETKQTSPALSEHSPNPPLLGVG